MFMNLQRIIEQSLAADFQTEFNTRTFKKVQEKLEVYKVILADRLGQNETN